MTYYLRQPRGAHLILGGLDVDAKDAGKLMQAHRKRMGLTQDQAAERSTVPTPQYLSALENGRYDVRNSEHFKSLVDLYRLTPEQVQEINPSAVFIFEAPASRRNPPVAPRLPEAEVPLEIPAALQQMIDKHGDDYPELHVEANLRALTSFYRYGGATDLSPQEWFEVFTTNRRWLVKT